MIRSAIVSVGIVVVGAAVRSQCTAKPSPAPQAAAPAVAGDALTPVLSVKELMEHIIDPTADWIFDAAVIDVNAKGTQTTTPVSDEDWLKVERGALLLAESSNLLKMPRAMVPAGTPVNEAPRRRAPKSRARLVEGRQGTEHRRSVSDRQRRRQGVRELPPGVLVSRRQEGRPRRSAEEGDVRARQEVNNFTSDQVSK
jgi:hypothetical protein